MISDEVYKLLSQRKGEKSFSEVIKIAIKGKKNKANSVSSLAGVLKGDKKLIKLKKMIQKEREQNFGREFSDW